MYVSDKHGSDQDGDGSEQKPFKTPLKAGFPHADIELHFFTNYHYMTDQYEGVP